MAIDVIQRANDQIAKLVDSDDQFPEDNTAQNDILFRGITDAQNAIDAISGGGPVGANTIVTTTNLGASAGETVAAGSYIALSVVVLTGTVTISDAGNPQVLTAGGTPSGFNLPNTGRTYGSDVTITTAAASSAYLTVLSVA